MEGVTRSLNPQTFEQIKRCKSPPRSKWGAEGGGKWRRTARDTITHWYKGSDLMRVYQGQMDRDWTSMWSNQILWMWPDFLNVAGLQSFWEAIDNDTGTGFLCIYWIFGIQSVWMLTFLDLEGGGRNLDFPQGRRPWLPLGTKREEKREGESGRALRGGA